MKKLLIILFCFQLLLFSSCKNDSQNKTFKDSIEYYNSSLSTFNFQKTNNYKKCDGYEFINNKEKKFWRKYLQKNDISHEEGKIDWFDKLTNDTIHEGHELWTALRDPECSIYHTPQNTDLSKSIVRGAPARTCNCDIWSLFLQDTTTLVWEPHNTVIE